MEERSLHEFLRTSAGLADDEVDLILTRCVEILPQDHDLQPEAILPRKSAPGSKPRLVVQALPLIRFNLKEFFLEAVPLLASMGTGLPALATAWPAYKALVGVFEVEIDGEAHYEVVRCLYEDFLGNVVDLPRLRARLIERGRVDPDQEPTLERIVADLEKLGVLDRKDGAYLVKTECVVGSFED